MKKITVISGKGGTGKTFLTASFASISKNKVIVDCDVDAANLYILLHPDIKKEEVFMGGYEVSINQDKCIKCGKCLTICRFDAVKTVKNKNNLIDKILIDKFSCEGCGACLYGCPVDAIEIKEKENGKWFISDTKYGPFIFAKLNVTSENSGKLVSKIKEEGCKIGEEIKADYVIMDGPPGIGCPVIASLSGVDIAIVVTEPTLSGISDMERVIGVAEFFKVETKVVINKYDINIENTKRIEEICKKREIDVIGYIPFSEKVFESVVQTIPYVEFSNDSITEEIKNIWEKIAKQ